MRERGFNLLRIVSQKSDNIVLLRERREKKKKESVKQHEKANILGNHLAAEKCKEYHHHCSCLTKALKKE